jgi:hypothetical protein
MILHIPATASSSVDMVVSDPALAQHDSDTEQFKPVPPAEPETVPSKDNLSEGDPSDSNSSGEIQSDEGTIGDNESTTENTDQEALNQSSEHQTGESATGTEDQHQEGTNSATKTDPKSDGAKKDTQTSQSDWSNVTAIGDSVMLDGKPYLEELLPGIKVDAMIGRQMFAGSKLLTQLQEQHKLGDTVIIGLGTNGVFNKKQQEKCLDSLQDVDRIILINTRVTDKWEGQVNKLLAEVADKPGISLFD